MLKAATITLTAKQANMVAWAIDPMEDFFLGMLEEGEINAMPPMPSLAGRALTLPADVYVVADLLYRLEDQLPDMAASELNTEGDVRAARNAADAIRAAAGYAGPALGSVAEEEFENYKAAHGH